MSSPAPRSASSCCAEGTTCAWRLHRTWLASSSRPALTAVAYGPDSHAQLEEEFFRNCWTIQQSDRPCCAKVRSTSAQGWAEMSATLTSLADGADLVVDRPDLPGAAPPTSRSTTTSRSLHCTTCRSSPTASSIPFLPPPLIRPRMTVGDLVATLARDEGGRRRTTPCTRPAKDNISSARRIAERGSLEIQAYDEIYFPGLGAEWNDRRPFVGALTLELPTDADDEVVSWIAAGPPPIYFGFGSMRVESLAATRHHDQRRPARS